jgi:outer membrane receptor protein involved in Fe transport
LPSYSALDASIAVGNDRWTARLYGRNLNDTLGYQFANGPLGGGLESVSILQPRTIGLSFDVSFK